MPAQAGGGVGESRHGRRAVPTTPDSGQTAHRLSSLVLHFQNLCSVFSHCKQQLLQLHICRLHETLLPPSHRKSLTERRSSTDMW